MWELLFDSYILLLLVFARMTGMLLFSPFLSRRNIPAIVKIGLALILSISIAPSLDIEIEYPSQIAFMFYIIKELFTGYVFGMALNTLMSWIFMGGEIIDLQLGISMSKLYDPSSNVSMPLSGTLYNVLFTLMFFTGNGHLTLIKIMARSILVFPPGGELLNSGAYAFIVLLLGDALSLALKLALPVLAIELLTEAGLGVLMRTVPQINIFSVGLQLKIVVGLFVIIAFLPAAAKLMDSTLSFSFAQAQKALSLLLEG